MLKFLRLLTLFLLCTAPMAALGEEPGEGHQHAIDDADLANGQLIYERGQHCGGGSIPFSGGPHWMRTKDTGCIDCHGPKGMGGIQPELCSATAPPIICDFLKKSGYSITGIHDQNNPSYNEVSLKNALKTGFKPNGFEMDFCMPRWKLTNKDFRDLLGYLHMLKGAE